MGDGDTTCIVCGAEMNQHPNNHHCDTKKENAIEGGRKSWERERQPSLSERLSYGFFLMGIENHALSKRT